MWLCVSADLHYYDMIIKYEINNVTMQLDWKGRYSYTEEEVKKIVKKQPGNYILLVKRKNVNYRPVYVGKADKYLEERLLEHFSNKEPNPCIKNHIKEHTMGMRYCYVDSEEDRKNVEHTLYHHYDRECNEKEPEGKKIDINFPF